MAQVVNVVTEAEAARFEAFEAALAGDGKARKTIDSYRSDWLGLARWHARTGAGRFDLKALTPAVLARFRDRCKADGLRPSTINRKLVACKRYVDWACDAGLLSDRERDALRAVGPVPQPRRRPRGLSTDELTRFLRVVEEQGTSRDQAIVQVLLESGLKVSELVSLHWEDLQLSTRRAVIEVGRGEERRQIAMGRPARRKLRRYLSERGEQNGALFLGERGPLTTNGVQRLVRKYCRLANVKVSPSTLRHTFAKGFLAASRGDLVALADLLGHECVETTRLYLQRDRRHFHEQLAAAS
ncbi:MAG: tyrosine-type recombinase/integrase [Myxococcales bacterium]|nr:tyrosine-type recombinase/integrase [Myxococcales bacterium]MCB9521763.1 tyrosine-type recombinase/integrase [Myxococcales bacterium]